MRERGWKVSYVNDKKKKKTLILMDKAFKRDYVCRFSNEMVHSEGMMIMIIIMVLITPLTNALLIQIVIVKFL